MDFLADNIVFLVEAFITVLVFGVVLYKATMYSNETPTDDNDR